METNRTRTTLITSLLTIALATGVGAYGTFAYFSDTGESVDNIFTSGTLDLKLDGQNDVGAVITHDNFAPGDIVNGSLVITNEGTISSYDDDDHTVVLDMNATLDAISSEEGATDMPTYLEVTNLTYDGDDLLPQIPDDSGNGYVDLQDLADNPLAGLDDPGQAGKVLDIEIAFHTSGGNDLQGDSVDATFAFTLQQQ